VAGKEASSTRQKRRTMNNTTANAETCAVPFLDNLTEMYNRNAFFIVAQHQMKIAFRNKRWLSLLLVDMKIEDHGTTSIQEQMIVDVAAIIKRTFRNSDIIARLGECEFAILAVEAHYSSSHLLLARLRENLEDFNIKENKQYRIGLNIGTAFFDPDHPCPLTDLLARAGATML
jgi:diguanylate cyclase (GGDEF)-like protein